jgi:hypothetical protein
LAAARPDPARVREVLAKSLSKKRLEPEETAVLLAINDPSLWQEVFAAARKLKNDVYGNRIVLFAPLYVGDKCINNCAYCGFKSSNRDVVRKTLSDEEFRSELVALEGQGHKRLILVWGEHPDYSAEEMARIVSIAYANQMLSNNDNVHVYSNGPDALWALAGVNATTVPRKMYYSSTKSINERGDLVGRWPPEDEAWLVWFNKIHRPHLFSVKELEEIASVVEVAHLSDGSIYRVSARKTTLQEPSHQVGGAPKEAPPESLPRGRR